MAKSNPTLEEYLQSQQDNLYFILHLLSLINQLPFPAYKTPKLTKLTILPKQKITLAQAWQIITQFLENHNAPYYLRQQTRRWQLTPESAFAVYHYLQTAELRLHQQSPELLHQLLESANQLAPTKETSAYQKALQTWRQQIKKYHRQLTQLQPHFAPNHILDTGIELLDSRQLSQSLTLILPQAIHLARQLDSQGQLTPDSLHLALKRLSPSDPNLKTLTTLLHHQDNRQKLFSVVQTHLPQLTQLTHQQTTIALNHPPSLPSTELERQIYLTLTRHTNLSAEEATHIARTILTLAKTQAIKGHLSPESLIKQAFRQHHLTPNDQLLTALNPLLPHLTLLQQEQRLHLNLARQHHAINPLTQWILKTIVRETGLDPQVLTGFNSNIIKEALQLDPSTSDDQLLQELHRRLNSAQDPQEINQLLHYLDFLQQKLTLDRYSRSKLLRWSTKLLLKSYQNNAKISAALNRYALAYQKGFDLYLKIDDIISGRWFWAKLENLKETWVGWIISPIEKLSLTWSGFVRTTVNNWLAKLSSPTTRLAKVTKKALELFRLGNYTIDGFIAESFRATTAWVYSRFTKLAQKATKPISKFIASVVQKVSAKLTLYLSSDFFAGVTGFLGTGIALGIQLSVLLWTFAEDTWSFIRDLFHAFQTPSLLLTLVRLWQAVRRWGTKNLSGLAGALIGAALTSWAGPAAILAAIAGFLLGHSIGELLNHIYEKYLKDFGLFLTSLVIAFTTFLGALTITGSLILLLGPILLILIPTLLYLGVNHSTRLPEGAGEMQSQYIRVTKHATATWKDKSMPGTIDNSQLPTTVTYTITVQARTDDLKNITIKDKAVLYQKKAGAKKATETTIREKTLTLDNLEVGQIYTYEYTLTLDDSYRDSFLSNSVTVTAIVNGQEEESSDGIGIAIGNPPLLPLADFASQLANIIAQRCSSGGKVTAANLESCKSNIFSLPGGQKAFPMLKYSASSYDVLQCVGFVKAVIAGTGIGTPFLGQSLDHAGELASPPMNGFHPVSTPQSGDVFIIAGNPGHIGVVVQVAGSNIIVADANAAGNGVTRPNGAIPISKIAIFYRPNP